MSAEDVWKEIEKNMPFIQGITVSGGECTLYPEFLTEQKAPLQMTFAKLFYTEANIAARSAAMNHQQLNLSREILIFRTFHADVLQMSRTCS